MPNKIIDINEIRQYATRNIEVGQEIYIPRKGHCVYFTKEKVTKISPKRTKLTTDKSRSSYDFDFEVYPVDNEEVNTFVHKSNKLNFIVLNLRVMCGNQWYHVSTKEIIDYLLDISEDEYEKLYQSIKTIKTSVETVARKSDS